MVQMYLVIEAFDIVPLKWQTAIQTFCLSFLNYSKFCFMFLVRRYIYIYINDKEERHDELDCIKCVILLA